KASLQRSLQGNGFGKMGLPRADSPGAACLKKYETQAASKMALQKSWRGFSLPLNSSVYANHAVGSQFVAQQPPGLCLLEGRRHLGSRGSEGREPRRRPTSDPGGL